MENQQNVVTAQGRTDPNQTTGISIQNCTAPDLANDLNSTSSYLGRPWKIYSRTVYMQSYIGDFVDPSGWLEWNGTLGLDTIFYGEFNNYGPGSITDNRVQWPGYFLLNDTQSWNFTVLNFTFVDSYRYHSSFLFLLTLGWGGEVCLIERSNVPITIVWTT
jgi:pectinesterase